MKIIVASNNKYKVEEIKDILKDLDFEVLSLQDAGIHIEPEETGETFEENAFIKARAVYDHIREQEKADPAKKNKKDYRNNLVLGDDSGLCVDYLEGEPGVYSSRWAGIPGDDAANNRKLLEELKGVPMEQRTARFISAMVLIGHKTDIRVKGKTEGYIIEEEKGYHGFGYDPLFFSSDLAKTFAEASSLEKNHVSHRARALAKLRVSLMKEGILTL